ncbi:hypothetical protein RHSIM_Rhsim06G0127500 [Rhododendron simsii]|uniref:F-box/LRR-repeat protein 15-like leucin rich repeat domain-containing protein n=1 Tax=Rhododendron simsii TaxID=118357 RepID=A0A834GX41_RHOSS|nr:hypothetical protein RHSIM_Rhsim06G0127500 [Rhododendron simsii]
MAKKGCKDLPDECWELIFNKLHQRHHSLLESLSLSCKRFLSLTNALRTHLTIVDPRVFPVSVLLNRFPNLNSIHLSCSRNKDTFNLTLEPLDLQRMTKDVAASDLNLESLSFSGTRLHLESLRMLGSRMKNLKVLMCSELHTLRDLELADEFEARSPGEVGVTDTGIEVLSSKLKSLRKIDVSGNEFLTDYSLITLSTNCIYLTDIVLCHCSFTNYGIEFVMRNSLNLSSLSVEGIEFGEFDEHSLCCARNIATLEIYTPSVPDEFLHLLVKAGFPLKSIHLEFSYFLPSFTLSGISSLLNKYRSLECLSLAQTYFLTDETMSDLSQCLSALVTIRLSFCYNLTESTFFTLAKNCPLLENITMESANLGGGDRAIEIVENPQIKYLNLEYNQNLSDECLAKLASVCPSLEVLDVSCCMGITEKGIADFLKTGSKIRKLCIEECRGIKNIRNGFELSELAFIGAAKSGINDDGLVVIGNRCHGLLNLDLDGCLGVTTVGLKEILTNCKRLRKINLTGCLNACMETVDWMVFSRPSLRKIILPHSYLPSKSQRQLFLHHGCLVLSE